MIAAISLPRLMRIGAGASKELAAVLQQLSLKSPMIVTDKFLSSSGKVDDLTAPLKAAGITARVFSDSVPDPTHCLDQCRPRLSQRGRSRLPDRLRRRQPDRQLESDCHSRRAWRQDVGL